MKLPLPVPAPYDFERSTFRFRMFGDDLASRWQGGGLHRVLGSGLPVRIEADGLTAYGAYTDRDRDEVATCSGRASTSTGSRGRIRRSRPAHQASGRRCWPIRSRRW